MTVNGLNGRVETWKLRGKLEDFRGHSIHTYHHDGDGPLLVLLHGFPTSSYDWRRLVERMPGRAVLAFDSSASASPTSPATTRTRSPGRPT